MAFTNPQGFQEAVGRILAANGGSSAGSHGSGNAALHAKNVEANKGEKDFMDGLLEGAMSAGMGELAGGMLGDALPGSVMDSAKDFQFGDGSNAGDFMKSGFGPANIGAGNAASGSLAGGSKGLSSMAELGSEALKGGTSIASDIIDNAGDLFKGSGGIMDMIKKLFGG